MNKNGFTLIEILVVIVLLAAVSVTVGVSMQGTQERQKNKEIENYKETIANAACVYAEIHDISTDSTVTLETLIKDGLLKKDLVNPKSNNTVEEEVNNDKSLYATIKWENNEKKCEFSLKD